MTDKCVSINRSFDVTLDVNCSERLIELKVITRKAKNASVALKELEEQMDKIYRLKIPYFGKIRKKDEFL
jgi:hypothetical protein